jgi:hypothetical protein
MRLLDYRHLWRTGGGPRGKQLVLTGILYSLTRVLQLSATMYPAVRKRMAQRNIVAQIRLKDNSIARYYIFRDGKVRSGVGLHPNPDALVFLDLATALTFLKPPQRQSEITHAAKQFRVQIHGRDELVVWFMQLVNFTMNARSKYGTRMRDGSVRYTSNTNGGPLFVYVKDDKIIRMTPIHLDQTDAASSTIRARNKTFKPVRRALINPHAQCLKSVVYSEKRLLHPMKRVDFDPRAR